MLWTEINEGDLYLVRSHDLDDKVPEDILSIRKGSSLYTAQWCTPPRLYTAFDEDTLYQLYTDSFKGTEEEAWEPIEYVLPKEFILCEEYW